MAAGILYGLSPGIRTPDHATVCKFRTQFGDQLKGLFRKVGWVAIGMGMVTLNQVTLDATA